ncbi:MULTISPECIES: glutathionylspermidine synthase family protein [unclassified Lysinibacillus]|uniref:glutathionylspermidine synthase family protein n=1 Tax=unclassified Lysinibacillus TaxID=2636778 RepID=UPI00201102E7|nr:MULTISPECIES: glutathionylspermidine synthase family protein [unclassified Lysinibacillus]MCL1696599.1 glutathionylspermidine synthase family protein [Lysinibacillus sp. BPa_S21]MCL1698917.1 glutathionylspermidine synthase family protein [Lysinibacillus sp. Bpr_S20]
MNKFREDRQQFFSQIKDFWHDIYGMEYALFDIKKESAETIQKIRQATDEIGHIFYKSAALLRMVDDDTLLGLGFPTETHSFIRLQTLPVESVIARLDLVVTEEQVKVLEINADTPTFIKETFFVNGKVCKQFEMENPNDGYEDQLKQAILKAVTSSLHSRGRNGANNIVFAAHSEHEEDKLTTMYLKELTGLKSQYMDFQQLQLLDKPILENEEVVLPQGLYDIYGEKIDVLYRQTYPIEHLIYDEDPLTKEKVGQSLMKLVKQQDLAIVNPPSAFLLQSKAIMALIWGLHEEQHSFYTREEHNAIHKYFLPTYLDPDVFLQQGQSFVKKPAFGREGDTVEIFSNTGKKIAEDIHKTYKDELPVYQQFIELPQTTIQTERGTKRVHYMYGCFYINGKASAMGIRAGGQITDNESYFLPIGY